MKIVFLHTDFRLYWIPRLQYLGHYLKEQGHELHIIEIAGAGSPYSFSDNRLSQGDFSWQCLFPNLTMEQLSAKDIATKIDGKLNDIAPDAIFSGAIAFPSGANAVRYATKNKIPIVIFDNARLCDVPRNKIVNWVKKQIYSNIDAMLIPAPSHVNDYEYWGIKESMIYFGLNVVDNKYWQNLSEDSAQLELVQKKYQLPKEFLLGVGRQIPKKNWLTLLTAYHKANCKTPLVLVGNGSERESMVKYIDANNIQDRISIFDFAKPEELAILYKLAKGVILPSLHGETWGLTVNEAMACSDPVLVSKQCGCCETLCLNGETGYNFEPNIEEISKALTAFENLNEIEHKTMQKNIENLIKEWGVDKFSKSVLECSQNLVATKNKRKGSLISQIIVKLWKGRYRPV